MKWKWNALGRRHSSTGKLAISGLLAAGLLVGCNSTPDNVKTAEKVNDQHTDTLNNQKSVTDSTSVPSKEDAEFIVKAKTGSQLEVTLGKMAETHAASPAVKRFGRMMVRDHSQGEKEILALAVGKRIIIPDTLSNQQEKEADELNKKNGRDFDKAYVKLMISDHKEDIDEFRKASGNANDPDIKALAAKTLPMLQEHLDSAQALQK
jgi:putative membrane protein